MQRRLIIVLGVVGLFAALLVTSVAMAGEPLSEVRGHGKVQLGPAELSVSQISVNAWTDGDGVAHGSLEWIGGVDSEARPTAYPWHMDVTSIDVSGNTATVCWVVVRAVNPDDIGTESCFEFTDGSPDTIHADFNAADPPSPLQAGNIIVR